MFYSDGSGEVTELTNGAATKVLTGNGVTSAPTWEDTTATHTQGTDTALGAMAEDIDMNTDYQIVSLQAPGASGEAIRQTATITEANLNTVTDNSIADAIHRHSELVASDGDPDPAFSIGATGLATFPAGTGINEFSIDGTMTGNSDDAVPTEQAVVEYVTGRTYLFTQAGAQATWTVNHNLGYQYCNVEVVVGGVSVTGTYDEPVITFVSVNQLTIVFDAAAAGVAQVVGGS